MSFFAPVLHHGFTPHDDNSPLLWGSRITASLDGRYSVCSVHGFGLFNGLPFTNKEELTDLLAGRHEKPEFLLDQFQGTFTLIVYDRQDREFFVATDVYGAGKIFVWEDEQRWAISSSLGDLVSFLEGQGLTPTKSLANAALIGFVGYGGGAVNSPYLEIRVVEQFRYIRASAEGIQEHVFRRVPQLLSVPSSRRQGELLDTVADEVRNTAAGFSSYNEENYICHLTGGLDSRTVLASLVGLGIHGRFRTHTYGLPESADMQIAKGLAGILGMQQTTYSGMRSRLTPSSPDEQAQWSLKQTAGMTSMTPASLGGFPVPDTVLLSGGWGEMYRSGYPDAPADNASREDLIRWGTNWVLRSGSPYGTRIAYGGLFSDEMVERARNYVDSIITETEELGIETDLLPEWMYLRWSCRFNVGEVTRATTPFVHRADPLCVPTMMQLIFATPASDRRSGALQLDLISKLSPGMELYQYDKNYLTDDYLRTRNVTKKPLPVNEAASIEKGPHDRATMLHVGASSGRATEAQKQEALRVKMPLRFIVRAEKNRATLKEALASYPNQMKEVFDTEKIARIAQADPKTRPEYRRLETLNAALGWYFE